MKDKFLSTSLINNQLENSLSKSKASIIASPPTVKKESKRRPSHPYNLRSRLKNKSIKRALFSEQSSSRKDKSSSKEEPTTKLILTRG